MAIPSVCTVIRCYVLNLRQEDIQKLQAIFKQVEAERAPQQTNLTPIHTASDKRMQLQVFV